MLKNSLFIQVLVEYELIHVKAWNKKLEQSEKSLNSSLLIRHPDTKELIVNFDSTISEVMREVDVMTQMDIVIPIKARQIRERREELKTKVEKIKV